MRKRPMLLAACVFVIGILFVSYRKWYLLLMAGGMLLHALIRLLRQRKWGRAIIRGLLLTIVFLLGAGKMVHDLDFRQEELSQIMEEKELLLQGEIEQKEFKNQSYTYVLTNCVALVSNRSVPCNQVMLHLDADSYSIGETILIKGKVNRFSTASNEGQFDMRSFYECQKIDFGMDDFVVLKSDMKIHKVEEWLFRLRQRLTRVYECSLDEASAGVLSVMLLGDKSLLDKQVKNLYQSAGISHILAISGLHVSLVGMSLYRFLRRRRRSFANSFAVAFMVLCLYAAMTGNSISTQRALGMIFLVMLAALLGRSYDLLNSLGAVALLLLWDNPFLLWYAGFQFSVVAVLGIGTLGTTIKLEEERTRKRTNKEKAIRVKLRRCVIGSRGSNEWSSYAVKLMNYAYGSIAVWLATLPLVAYHYYEVPVYSVALNMLLLPTLKIVFVLGFLGGFIGSLGSFIGSFGNFTGGIGSFTGGFGSGALLKVAKVILCPCRWLLNLYDFLATVVLQIPGAQVIVGRPSMQRIILFYLIFLCFAYLCKMLEWKRTQGVKSSVNTVRVLDEGNVEKGKWNQSLWQHSARWVGIGLLCLLLFWPNKKSFEIDMLDVGQGDGIYLYMDAGVTAFIDGGSCNFKTVGDNRILPFLKYNGVKSVDYWFVSHTDEDHISGLRQVLTFGYKIKNLVVSAESYYRAQNDGDDALIELIALAEENGTRLLLMQAGNSIYFSNSEERISCIWPLDKNYSYDKNHDKNYDKNDLSLVILYEGRNQTALFTGDISSEVERDEQFQSEILGRLGGRNLDIYKVAHHGSRYSNSEEILELLHPNVALVSCGRNNSYGHPHDETLERIKKYAPESRLYRTDEYGQISIRVDKEIVTYEMY